MKKFLISLLFIGGFGAYVLLNNSQQTQAETASTGSTNTNTDTNGGTDAAATGPSVNLTQEGLKNTVAAKPTPKPVPTPTPVKKTGQYADGSYVGSAADAYYGLVQVKATISGGKLTNVAFLQFPNDRSTSIMINRQAMPMLTQEAISAQSANVDGVSGASDTSAAFAESLGSALAKAKA